MNLPVRILLPALCICLSLLLPSTVAEADDRQVVRNADSGGYVLSARDDGEPGRESAGSTRAKKASTKAERTCWFAPVRDLDSIEYRLGEVPKSPTGYYTAEVCSDGTSRLFYLPRGGYIFPVAADAPTPAAPVVTPEILAQQAYANLNVPQPQIRTAPRRGTPTLAGLATWFWLDTSQRDSRSAQAQAGSVWAEAVVKAQRITIEPNQGAAPVVCDNLGTPYDSKRPANEQSTDCFYTYRAPGTYEVTVTVEWDGEWRGSGGAGGSLPAVSQSTTFEIVVQEARSELVAG
jgi:hypothetical protein